MSKRLLVTVFLGIVFAYAGVALARVVVKTLDPAEGYDFFSYWQPLQFVRQGIDPYTQTAHGDPAVLHYPLVHVNGLTVDDRWYAVVGAPYPANTPMMLFLLFPFSLFTWEAAKALWFATNLLLLACSIGLSVRIVTGKWGYLRTLAGVTYTGVVLGMLAVRNVFGVGQTTLLIVTCILLSLYSQVAQRKWLAGLLLGLALSKFTLGMALFVYFLYKRQWLSLLLAVLVQTAGFALLALTTGVPLGSAVTAYASLAAALAGVEGIHLGAYLAWPPLVASLAITVLFAGLGALATRLPGKTKSSQQRDFVVFGLICNWALLAVYHRYYDLTLLLFGLMLFFHSVSDPVAWGLSTRERQVMALLTLGCSALLMLPGSAIEPLLPMSVFAVYLQLVMVSGTLAPILMTAGLLFLRTPSSDAPVGDNSVRLALPADQ